MVEETKDAEASKGHAGRARTEEKVDGSRGPGETGETKESAEAQRIGWRDLIKALGLTLAFAIVLALAAILLVPAVRGWATALGLDVFGARGFWAANTGWVALSVAFVAAVVGAIGATVGTWFVAKSVGQELLETSERYASNRAEAESKAQLARDRAARRDASQRAKGEHGAQARRDARAESNARARMEDEDARARSRQRVLLLSRRCEAAGEDLRRLAEVLFGDFRLVMDAPTGSSMRNYAPQIVAHLDEVRVRLLSVVDYLPEGDLRAEAEAYSGHTDITGLSSLSETYEAAVADKKAPGPEDPVPDILPSRTEMMRLAGDCGEHCRAWGKELALWAYVVLDGDPPNRILTPELKKLADR